MTTQRKRKELISIPGVNLPAGNVVGIKAGGLLWYSALRADGADVKEQARNALAALKRNLEAAGATLDDVVKATVYFQDIADRLPFHEVWMEHFSGPEYPARIVVQVADASMRPGGGSQFAIDIVALAPESCRCPQRS
ncbi:MAG: RidA family protein [SAR202 cluster bacterium]|nr:RidA family protein [SAR202 cluster bacterium]